MLALDKLVKAVGDLIESGVSALGLGPGWVTLVQLVAACLVIVGFMSLLGVVSLLAYVGLSLILMGPMEHAGLALANSLASMINIVLLLIWLRRRIGKIDWARILKSLIQVAVASIVMGWAASC